MAPREASAVGPGDFRAGSAFRRFTSRGANTAVRMNRLWPTLALILAVALLSAATVVHYRGLADRQALTVTGRTAFARYVAGRPGFFDRPALKRRGRVDVLCALHRPAAGAPANYELCLGVAPGTQRVVSAHRRSAAAARLGHARAQQAQQGGA
jgi:hypothetical protein